MSEASEAHQGREPTEEELAALVEAKRREYAQAEARQRESDLHSVAGAGSFSSGPPQTPRTLQSRKVECFRCGDVFTETVFSSTPQPEADGQRMCEVCEWEADIAVWEETQRQKRLVQLKAKSELPKRLSGMKLLDYEPATKSTQAALRTCNAYVAGFGENGGEGLVLFGSPGTGKTHLAVGVMQELVERGIPSLFVTVPTLLQNMRDAFREEGRGEDWLKRAKEADLLLLDDVGAHKSSEWADEVMFVLINHRYAEGLPTILTTNLSPPELAQSIGERTVSRLVEMSEWIALEGDDYRWRKFK